ncbi:hypothetical protein BX661DRAFT_76559 [Kickxella alabastrina]|uniref:uncharacterized protein n=1 Tax=Kickxella alabastrina TaxID=61397 RepID=UPI0022207F1C|nr:uncharacterized protein BX661DRAFT_72044 [Kickxella alabastrina]XP_051393904.1 uncharacterized protein BX661DRAFT_76559 [Kickxella alabastrina]KAI7833269.1 hypothetical protein BX661DRAFT_72044 [Kickxella alabastrina]KAI7833516.1 hypothetical protein BX661DRAFT_76559 [Kickxella alabastrina]
MIEMQSDDSQTTKCTENSIGVREGVRFYVTVSVCNLFYFPWQLLLIAQAVAARLCVYFECFFRIFFVSGRIVCLFPQINKHHSSFTSLCALARARMLACLNLFLFWCLLKGCFPSFFTDMRQTRSDIAVILK